MNNQPRAEHLSAATGLSGSARPGQAEARYVLPSFVERTPYGIKEMNPYNKLF
jgi:ATP-dependent Clp protease protease subunit